VEDIEVAEIEDWMLRMDLNWIVDENGIPHQWHGHPVEWSRWMWHEKRVGGLAIVGRAEWLDGTRVSTVFLGVDMGFGMGPPYFWESMIFGPRYDHDRPQHRYHSQREALEGHRTLLAGVISEMGSEPNFAETWIPPEDRLTSGMSRLTVGDPSVMDVSERAGEEPGSGDDREPRSVERA
jgi:hypothetical protein